MMNKKKAINFVLLIALNLLISCNLSKEHKKKCNIEGKWNVLLEKKDNIISNFNMCPIIIFHKNWTGQIIENNESYNFTYSFSKNCRFIYFRMNKDFSVIPSGNYCIKFYNNNSIRKIELTIKNDHSFVLSQTRVMYKNVAR